MLKRFAAVAIGLILIWAISLERTYAWLGLQSAASDRWLSTGMHPLSFDFTSSARGDVRWQLIGQGAFGATVKAESDGLHVQPVQNSFELRLNLAGARLFPAQVKALELDVSPLAAGGALPKFSLAVHAALDDPGWIAELPISDLAGASNHSRVIDLNTLDFKREPQRLITANWAELPALTQIRLYGNSPSNEPFTLAAVAFQSAQKTVHAELAGLRPEALLQAFDEARAGRANADILVASTDYRGPWFAPVVQIWVSVIGLILVCVLLGFEFASDSTKQRACARVLMLPAIFLPIIMMLWGNVNWPVDNGAAFAPQWFVLMLGLIIAIGYRCITTPPRVKRFSFNSQTKLAWLSCAIPTLAAALALVLAFGARSARFELDDQRFGLLLAFKYLAFAGFQQWLLQTLVWANLRRAAMPRWAAVLLSACVFALLHTPNFMLMSLCFIGALFWCWHYAKHRRLLPLILSHAFLGYLCVSLIPTSVLRSADIGVAYFLK